LEGEERLVAGIYCYYYNGVYSYYQSGRDLRYSKYHIGLVLMNKVIEEAIKEGAVIFDFLTGDESYKYRWAQSSRKNLRIKCWNNGNK
jgi:CelD/BcsL family acetyltransferase involved in cellulose biosynthesis